MKHFNNDAKSVYIFFTTVLKIQGFIDRNEEYSFKIFRKHRKTLVSQDYYKRKHQFNKFTLKENLERNILPSPIERTC